MLEGLLRKITGSRHVRELKKIQPVVEAINALEPGISSLSDAELQAKCERSGGWWRGTLIPEYCERESPFP